MSGPAPAGPGKAMTACISSIRSGKLIGHVNLPEICANICFGGPKRNQLFMAASQSLYMMWVNTRGAHIC